MEALSPVFAALGAIEFDVLNDLSDWLDGPVAPTGAAQAPGRPGRAADPSMLAADRHFDWEG
ncbi:MAG TPA: hypothetical protein VF759_15270 [Allosphingosinicella sp.]|jgi:hypothetical protein